MFDPPGKVFLKASITFRLLFLSNRVFTVTRLFAPCKEIQGNLGFRIPHHWIPVTSDWIGWIPDSASLDSGFQTFYLCIHSSLRADSTIRYNVCNSSTLVSLIVSMFKGTRYFHDFNSGFKSGTSQILHEKKKKEDTLLYLVTGSLYLNAGCVIVYNINRTLHAL